MVPYPTRSSYSFISSRLALASLVAVALPLVPAVAQAKDAPPPAAVSITGDGEGKHPTIAADAKAKLHAAYEATDAGGKTPDIFYVSSADGGKTWSKPVNVSGTPGVSADPAIAAGKDGSLAIVWSDTSSGESHPDIYLARSADGGKTWGKPVNVSNTPGHSTEPDVKIAADGGLYVVWLDTTAQSDSPDVWATASHDGGKTWSKAQNVSNTPGKSMTPSLAVGPDNAVNVVWTDTTSGAASPDVYFSRSSDEGKTWSKAVDVSNTPGASADCDVAVDDKGHIYVVWSDTSESAKSPDIMVAASTDAGKTWSKPVDASNTPWVSSDPAVAATGNGKVAVIWVDTSANEKSPDVWMAASSDGGKSFGKPANISNTPGISEEPDITIAGGKVLAIWEEEDGGKEKVKVVSAPLP